MTDALIGAAWLVGIYWTLMLLVFVWDIGNMPSGKPVRIMWEKIFTLTLMCGVVGGFWGWLL